jgi:hypothetical protein
MATKTDIAKLFELIKQLYPRFEFTRETVEAWFRVCGKCTMPSLEAAVDAYAKEMKYTPSASDIYKRARPRATQAICEGTFQELIAYNAKHDIVPYWDKTERCCTWWSKSYCVLRKGKYVPKIHYVMDKLGARKVERILREEMKQRDTKTAGRKHYYLDSYPEILEELIHLADTQPADVF